MDHKPPTSHSQTFKSGQFFVVATPIGNLEDLTPRGLRVLQSANVILSEDTRMTEQLLNHLHIRGEQKLIRFDQHKEAETSSLDFMVGKIKEQLELGLNLVLVSDAGTPGISDPGAKLLEKLHDFEISVTPIPGASAITTFISAVGVLSNSFTFNGFLPKDEKKKEKLFTELDQNWSVVESTQSSQRNRKGFFKNIPAQLFF